MADLTTATTFTYSVQGNQRVIICDVSSAGGTTADTVVIPHLTAIQALEGRFRGGTPAPTLATTAVMSTVGAIWTTARADAETMRTAIVNLAAGGGSPILSASTSTSGLNAINIVRSTDAVGLALEITARGR